MRSYNYRGSDIVLWGSWQPPPLAHGGGCLHYSYKVPSCKGRDFYRLGDIFLIYSIHNTNWEKSLKTLVKYKIRNERAPECLILRLFKNE